MTRFQSWFKKGWANPRPEGDTDFPSGKAALSWAGHWTYGKYAESLGDDLIVIPMPNFGRGPKTGLGTWNFGVPSSCRNPEGAWTLLEYILRPEKILRWTTMHPGVPARKSALAHSKLYGPGGPLNVYVQQIEKGWAVPRPLTPAYGAITKAFAEAVDNIIRGADVETELSKAASRIDQDIKDHNGYPSR
jgi:multiple sugar transport system substrate-binding protein